MMLLKRLEQITQILEQQGSAEVSALSSLLGVTEKTVCQDLIKLEELQIAIRVHGGAVLKKTENGIYPIGSRKLKHAEEKERIARGALGLIEEGDILILDTGSTTLELAKILDRSVIVITNDPFIAAALIDNEEVTLYTTGGMLKRDQNSYAYIGADAIRMLSSYHAHKCFIGTSALDFKNGLMIFSANEVETKQAMLRSSRQAICLLDYSKFHRMAFSSFAQLQDIDHIVTDSSITDEDKDRLTEMGLHLTIV